MSRWNQVTGVSAEEKAKAKSKIIAKAKKFGIDTTGFEKGSEKNTLIGDNLLEFENEENTESKLRAL